MIFRFNERMTVVDYDNENIEHNHSYPSDIIDRITLNLMMLLLN